MTRLLVLGLALLTLAGPLGCGKEHPAEKAFGGLNDHDAVALDAFFDAGPRFPDDHLALNRALEDDDLPTARQALDRMFTAVGEMAHRAAVLQSEPVRRTLGQYVGVLRESLFAYEDLLLLLEGERKHRRPPSERRLRQVVERVEETARRAAEADNRLIRLMTIEMSPEERERFLDSIGVRPDSA